MQAGPFTSLAQKNQILEDKAYKIAKTTLELKIQKKSSPG
jgi:hypothetical protein